jgi:hypothetical protein
VFEALRVSPFDVWRKTIYVALVGLIATVWDIITLRAMDLFKEVRSPGRVVGVIILEAISFSRISIVY